jgi:phosphoglycolate phosphatase
MSNGIALLWDIDGTLLSTHGLGQKPLLQAIHTVTGVDANYELNAVSGLTDHQIVDLILKNHEYGDINRLHLIPKIITLYCDLYEKLVPSPHIRQLNDVDNILSCLSKNRNLRNWICTGNTKRGAVLKIKAAKLNRHFSLKDYFCSETLEPRSNILARADSRSRRLNLRSIVIGDTFHDVEASKILGLDCVALESENYPLKHLIDAKPKSILKIGWTAEDLLSAIYD